MSVDVTKDSVSMTRPFAVVELSKNDVASCSRTFKFLAEVIVFAKFAHILQRGGSLVLNHTDRNDTLLPCFGAKQDIESISAAQRK